jgi:hypothetical protein
MLSTRLFGLTLPPGRDPVSHRETNDQVVDAHACLIQDRQESWHVVATLLDDRRGPEAKRAEFDKEYLPWRQGTSIKEGSVGTESRRTLLQDLRADPHHASELVLLRVLAQVGPNVTAGNPGNRPGLSVEQATKRLIRRATSLARRDGAIIGSSFYVGMPSAMAMIYCHQLLLVLRIAALYGREPAHPARAAEMLVFQGRYADMEAAAAALRRAGTAAASDHHGFSIRTIVVQTARQVPQMVGMRVQKVRRGGPWGMVISAASLASYLVPFVGVPALAASNGRATRQLGKQAVAYYAAHPEPPAPDPEVVLPQRPGVRARILLTCAVIAAGVILGVAAAMIPLGTTRLDVPRWAVIVLMEVFLAATLSRLLWITRQRSTTSSA